MAFGMNRESEGHYSHKYFERAVHLDNGSAGPNAYGILAEIELDASEPHWVLCPSAVFSADGKLHIVKDKEFPTIVPMKGHACRPLHGDSLDVFVERFNNRVDESKKKNSGEKDSKLIIS